MKIVAQNFKTGVLSVHEVPNPRVNAGSILVRTSTSLISAGTDRAIIGLGKKSYIGKALDRPDLARKVINRARNEGFWSTYKVVQNLLAEPIPLGYSLVGAVIDVGQNVRDIALGDRVACAGLGHANHAEYVVIPNNLAVKVPKAVGDEQAAYVTLGAIAMHGFRQAEQQMGATVLVVGLGLVGQIMVQLCAAAGMRVIGLDVDPRKFELAKAGGAYATATPDDQNLATTVASLTHGFGIDAALLTAASKDSGGVFEQVAKLCRDRARVVVVGDIKMDISRRTYFEKELDIIQSRSYGPGRYDPSYELGGNDYPIGYVRWTERRNFSSFLDLVADRRIDPAKLTTHRFAIEQASEAYDLVTGKSEALSVGVLLNYPSQQPELRPPARSGAAKGTAAGRIRLGIIGTGQFAKGILIPAILDTAAFELIGVASARGLSAKSVADRYRAKYADSDAARVLNDPEVDAVVIATRHDSHARLVVEALRRDKHVFVEKPLCIRADELDLIETAARQSKGTLLVGFNRRFSPMVKAICEHFAGRTEPLAMLYRANAGRIPMNSEAGWLHDPATGGGRVIGEACHFVDTMQAVTGARPTVVQALSVLPRRADLAHDDIVTFTIGFDDGSMGTIHFWSNGNASYPKERFEVFSQERIAILDNFRSLELVAGHSTKRRRAINADKGFAEEAAAFVEACRSGRSAVPVESVLDTTRVTLAVMTALGRSLDVEFSEPRPDPNP